MGRKDALASLIGGGEGSRDAASELARDIDWGKIRRVQHGLCRPHEKHGLLPGGLLSEEEKELDQKRSRNAARLAHAFGFVAGVLLGLSFLQNISADRLLLAASLFVAFAGVATAKSTT